MERQCEHIHLEHDGKLLLVDMNGNGPAIPKMGRGNWDGEGFLISLPPPEEAEAMASQRRLGRHGLEKALARMYSPAYG